MVDTICLKITNLNKYNWIGSVWDLSTRKEGITVMQIEDIPGDYRNDVANIKEIRYNDTGKRKVLYSNHIFLRSSHYYLAYKIDDLKDCIDFNFSIPKYIYGTNVIQFVPHIFDKKNVHARTDLENYDYIESITYDRLNEFLDYFIERYSFNTVIDGESVKLKFDKKDIEITRIDLCFNQYFNSRKDALEYLKYQKRIKKSYLRENSKNKIDWGSSIFLQTKTYVAKIYHKGKEYSSGTGERKHHEKINRSARKEIFPVDVLQDEADKILRYEISFKNAYLSRIYKKEIFRKNCPFHKALKQAYKTCKQIEEKCDRLIELEATKITECNDVQEKRKIHEKFRRMRKEIKLPLKEELEYIKKFKIVSNKKNKTLTVSDAGKTYNQMLNQNNCFMLDITEDAKKYNRHTVELNFDYKGNVKLNKEVKFSRSLFKEMQKIFRGFINEFQLSERLTMDQVGVHLVGYNQHIENIKSLFPGERKIYEGPLAQISALMESYTIDEMVQLGIISRKTKYNYLKRLEKLKLNKASILPVPIRTSVDFSSYQFHRNNLGAFNPNSNIA